MSLECEVPFVHSHFVDTETKLAPVSIRGLSIQYNGIFPCRTEPEAGAHSQCDLQTNIALERSQCCLPHPAEILTELDVRSETHRAVRLSDNPRPRSQILDGFYLLWQPDSFNQPGNRISTADVIGELPHDRIQTLSTDVCAECQLSGGTKRH